MEWVLLLNLASTGVMIGVIWFVQVVHYPLFGGVGRDGWTDYAAAHGRRTTLVVGLPMLIERATGVPLVLRPPARRPRLRRGARAAHRAVGRPADADRAGDRRPARPPPAAGDPAGRALGR